MDDWRARVERELEIAESARARGNEGMARVAARRAAGWVVEAYLAKQGVDRGTASVLDHIRYLLAQNPDPEIKPILEHMLVALEKDDPRGESYWPLEADLLAEARHLLAALFPNLK
jgi:hypothetical protein